MSRFIVFGLLLCLLALTVAAAAAGAFAVFFTDNMDSTGVDPAPTVLESALLNRLHAADSTIDAAFYDFNRDSIRDALIAAHNRGVTVRVVTDDEARFYIASYIPYYAALEAAGIPVKDDEREHTIMHNKYFIVDGAAVWTGSTNMSDNGFTKNHNNGVWIESSALAALYQADFDQMWAGNFSTNKTAAATTALTFDGVATELYFSPKDDALDALIAEVAAAQESIEFGIFFFTADGLRDALIERAQAGVAVRGVWDLLGAASPYSDDEALCAAGVPIRIEDTIGKMHNKFMVIDAEGDDPRVVTGSMNWTTSGDASNDENTLILHDANLAVAYADTFAAMWQALGPETQCETPELHNVYLPTMLNNYDASAPPLADVRLQTIRYNPDGDDLAGEFVSLVNSGGTSQSLTGWTLRDEADTVFTFPMITIRPQATVIVWVKSGSDTSTDLYWGRGSAVWNNTGDVATLRDAGGTHIDSCSYEGGGVEIDCN